MTLNKNENKLPNISFRIIPLTTLNQTEEAATGLPIIRREKEGVGFEG